MVTSLFFINSDFKQKQKIDTNTGIKAYAINRKYLYLKRKHTVNT